MLYYSGNYEGIEGHLISTHHVASYIEAGHGIGGQGKEKKVIGGSSVVLHNAREQLLFPQLGRAGSELIILYEIESWGASFIIYVLYIKTSIYTS